MCPIQNTFSRLTCFFRLGLSAVRAYAYSNTVLVFELLFQGIVPPDFIAKYGPDSLSGHIMMGSFPHRNMHSEVVHPVILSLIPGLMTEDIALFAKTLPEFVLSCVSPNHKLPYDVYTQWLGGAAPRVSNYTSGFFVLEILSGPYRAAVYAWSRSRLHRYYGGC